MYNHIINTKLIFLQPEFSYLCVTHEDSMTSLKEEPHFLAQLCKL